jgi:hypothetical protein
VTNRISHITVSDIQSRLRAKCNQGGNGGHNYTCYEGECFGHGKCVEDLVTRKPHCVCDAHYEGPRCQLTARKFDGNDIVVAPPLFTVDSLHFSMEFKFHYGVTDGLLMFIGGGTKRCAILIRESVLVLQLQTSQFNAREVAIGEPLPLGNVRHRIDLTRNDTHLVVTVDRCSGTPQKHECTTSIVLRDLDVCMRQCVVS